MFLLISTFFLCTQVVQAQNFVSGEKDISLIDEIEADFKQLYLVFAGPYPASPSSAFGHLFFLVQPTSINKSNPQLWRAINFSADVEGYSGLSTFYNGLLGNLDGSFEDLSFYKKIRDYSYAESRDLWLFPVKLTEDEKSRFVHYIEGKKDTLLQYSFINKNCATRVKEALYYTFDQSINKDIYVLPQDVLKSEIIAQRLSDPLWIENIEGQLLDLISRFGTEEYSREEIELLDANEKVYFLKTLEWLYNNKSVSVDTDKLEYIRKLRFQVAQEKSDYQFSSLEPKEFKIHPPSLFGIDYMYAKNSSTNILLDFRIGLHGFTDNAGTYPKYDYIDILRFRPVISKSLVYMDEFWLFNQSSRQPRNELNSSISWSLGLGGDRFLYKDQSLMAIGLYTSIGQTVSMLQEFWTSSLILSFNTTYLEKNNLSLILNPKIENRVFASKKVKGFIEISNPVFLNSSILLEPNLKFKGVYSVAKNLFLTNTFELQSKFYSVQLGLSFNFNI